MLIMELTDGIFQQIVDGKVDGFFHHNQNLYVKTKDKSLLVYENGSDTPRVLVEEFTLMWTTIFGQYLYGCNGFDMCRVDLQAETPVVETLVENAKGMTDGQHIYYVNLAEDNHLYRCDMDGANPTLLVDQPVLLASINFDNDYFITGCIPAEIWMAGKTATIFTACPNQTQLRWRRLPPWQNRCIRCTPRRDTTRFLFP